MFNEKTALDRELAIEYLRAPHGPHSPALQALLYEFRLSSGGPAQALVCKTPGREWVLVELGSKRGDPITIHEDHVFTSRADADRAWFRRCWRAVTGEKPDSS